MNDVITILTIDDDSQITYALNALFRRQGWKAISAENVADGLEFFQKHIPDLVLIDYHMPGINGVAGVERLRQLSQSIPIIVFTIDESQRIADEFLRVGANDFAIKPIKAPDIISRIKLHLRLLEQQKIRDADAAFAEKGIGVGTLKLITEYLSSQPEYVSANEVASNTGLAYPTAYRYLQYLARKGQAETINTYGKVGKPNKKYRLL